MRAPKRFGILVTSIPLPLSELWMVPLPRTHSFVIGPAVINTHKHTLTVTKSRGSAPKWLSTKKSAPHGDPRPDILSPWRRRLSLPIPCHVHWQRSCCQSRARTAAICKKACFRGPTGYKVQRVDTGTCVFGPFLRAGCACVFGPFLRAGCAGAAWVRGGSLLSPKSQRT